MILKRSLSPTAAPLLGFAPLLAGPQALAGFEAAACLESDAEDLSHRADFVSEEVQHGSDYSLSYQEK